MAAKSSYLQGHSYEKLENANNTKIKHPIWANFFLLPFMTATFEEITDAKFPDPRSFSRSSIGKNGKVLITARNVAYG
jgi:hypothetical protein